MIPETIIKYKKETICQIEFNMQGKYTIIFSTQFFVCTMKNGIFTIIDVTLTNCDKAKKTWIVYGGALKSIDLEQKN
jgi:hypothetical protein